MTEPPVPSADGAYDARYEIRVEGHLSDPLLAAFAGATSERRADGSTTLVLPAGDQAALHAALRTVRDLGLTLRCVARCPPDRPTKP